jgi:hypothetical protein
LHQQQQKLQSWTPRVSMKPFCLTSPLTSNAQQTRDAHTSLDLPLSHHSCVFLNELDQWQPEKTQNRGKTRK